MKIVVLGLSLASACWAATCFLTVAGLGGEPDYEQRFAGWAKAIETTLRASRAEARLETLTGAAATRENLKAALQRFARDCGPRDDLVVMLIGHGSFDGFEYKFNVPGPDVTAEELAALLDKVPAQRQLVVNMTSASGASLAPLSRPGRIVITATKSGTEKNATVFARYWAEALRDPAADTDKNEAISALEAFRYAQRKTAEFYEAQKRIATEHALLDDSGRGEGVRTPSAEDAQGRLAASFTLLRFGAAQEAARDPEKRKLLARKEQLEQEIDRLKYQKPAMPLEEYRRQLTALLVELARTQEALEK
ncbi:MAG: hypothetical protein RMK57_02835 [Bryobacterales bacterium]|nr:hypothetical protein [Bryobacteraceae bacterium]MDW8353444.1 hypothetical protein [Bryobacterales bacterium]